MKVALKVALFGAGGQVGADCARQLADNGYQLIPVTRDKVDFAQERQIAAFIKEYSPDFVINACAYTAVDRAEQEKALADQVNHLSVGVLAQVCCSNSIPLLHLSTDYVFDGVSKVPYIEEDSVNPLGAYGETKLAGERVIQAFHDQYIILRTSWVFGEYGNNFVKTMLRLGKERDSLGVVADQYGCPTYTGEIVAVILTLLAQYQQTKTLPWGIYHCSCCDEVSWYQFACDIFNRAIKVDLLKKMPEVKPITTAQYPTPAPRPAYSVLDNTKLEKVLDRPMSSWRPGLDHMLSLQES